MYVEALSDLGYLLAQWADKGVVIFFPQIPGEKAARDYIGLYAMTFRGSLARFGSLEMDTESPPTVYGERLLRAIIARRLTPDELGERTGLNRSTIHRLLGSKEEKPTLQKETIIALTKALDPIDGWWLLTGEGEPPHGNDRSTNHEG